MVTFCAVVLFVSRQYTEGAALESIRGWQTALTNDMAWEAGTFRKAYGEIKPLGLEGSSKTAPRCLRA